MSWRVLLLLAAALPLQSEANRPCDSAISALQAYGRQHGLQAEIRCALLSRPRVPAGLDASTRLWSPAMPARSGLIDVPVPARQDGLPTDVDRVPVIVYWHSAAWVASRSIAAGEWLQPSDLIQQVVRWPEGVPIETATDVAPLGRVRRSLPTGAIVSMQSLLPSNELLRGDRVVAVLVHDGLEVTFPASLLAAARVGGEARVQPVGRPDVLQGTMIDGRTLMVSAR